MSQDFNPSSTASEAPHSPLNAFEQPDRHHPLLHVPADVRVAVADKNRTDKPTHDRFRNLCGQLISQRLQDSPVAATSAGDHRFDHLLDDVSADAFAGQGENASQLLREFQHLDTHHLSMDEKVDYLIAVNALERDVFELQTLRHWCWNPLYYNQVLGGGLFSLMSRMFASPAAQAESILARVGRVPRFLAQAQANLTDAPQVHIETSIQQSSGLISLLHGELRKFVSQTPSLASDFDRVAQTAESAIHHYIDFLRTELAPRSKRDFRLGEALWTEQLHLTINSELTAADVLARAEESFEEIKLQLYDVSCKVLEQHGISHPHSRTDAAQRDTVIRTAMEFTAQDKATTENLLDTVRKTVVEAIDFARECDLVTLPSEPIEVMAVPQFMRGIGVAYCDSPGPLDRHLKTYYMVSPPPDEWTQDQTDSFLREYNLWMIRNLSVHEAIPGHYVQIAHANQHPSVLRAVLASGTFVEGWAVYAESVMADAGFGGDLRLKLMQLKMALRATTNAILDQKLHTAGMTESEAMALMVDRAYQEQSEAMGKWRRAQLTSCQLSTYFIGLEEWKQLRKAAEREAAARGGRLNLAAFHNRALSFGSPPPRLARRLMNLA